MVTEPPHTAQECADAWALVLSAALTSIIDHLPPGEGHTAAIVVRNGKTPAGHMFLSTDTTAGISQALAELESHDSFRGTVDDGSSDLKRSTRGTVQ